MNNPTIQFSCPQCGFKEAPTQSDSTDVLASSIQAYVREHGGSISPVIQELMVKSLSGFVMVATEKFWRGQMEHGGDIRDRNLQVEISQEVIDLFWYNEAHGSWPNHLR